MRLSVAIVLTVVAGCRLGFGPVDTGARDGAGAGTDAPIVYDDAPIAGYCTPLGAVVTADQCAAARADPANTPDQVLFDCADACALRQCVLFEGPADGCPNCACNAYIKTSVICDSSGLCGAPLNGTGCITIGGFTGAPWNCPSGGTVQQTFACVVRVLFAMNDC